jgi:hypothetical protein
MLGDGAARLLIRRECQSSLPELDSPISEASLPVHDGQVLYAAEMSRIDFDGTFQRPNGVVRLALLGE